MREEASRAWREVDLNALAHNARTLQAALCSGCRLMAVVKADAYGHGAIPVARRLEAEGVKAFAVACLEEGIALRQAGVRGKILILGYTPPEMASLIYRWKLIQTVADEDHGRALAAQGVPLSVHLALDTGMHRLGIPAKDHKALQHLYELPNLNIEGVFSHLCMSDSLEAEDMAFTHTQLERFYGAVQWLRAHGLDPGEVHIQASYGIWNLPPQPCFWARAGIALYGVFSKDATTGRTLALGPALSLRARVVSVRTLLPGEGAGYGLAFRAEQMRKLAVVSIGYADGLPRCLPQQKGEVLLHAARCPMVGRMCMDQLLVDVTDVPCVKPGDVATIIGTDGGQVIRAEDVAGQCGTITNELLSRLGHRLPIVTDWKSHVG
ncbi:MAG TPA: serine racemase VanT catalytic subunit [Candidatus Galloscillospira stercoripullorum]|nr:serine racemase VanT catalytic subunit [Candidatus Galloscillospira stercoripullorum]